MSVITKNSTLEKGFGPPVFSTEVKNHNNDPFVVKKVEKAKEILKKVGLPSVKKI